MLWTKVLVAAIAGAWGAALTNRGIAVYHDGLRAVMPELIEGRMSQRELASIAFGLSFGLLIGFGIPFSLVSAILLIHSLWLGTDLIGTWFPSPQGQPLSLDWKRYWGLAGASVAGALYGALLVLGLEGFTTFFSRLPVNIFDSLGSFNTPIIFTFAAFPAIAAAYQFGARKGLVTFFVIVLVRQLASTFDLVKPNGWALAIGLVVFLVYALQEKEEVPPGEELTTVFSQRAIRIRNHLPEIAFLGAIYGLAIYLSIFMEGPQSLGALALGDKTTAIHFTIARALSFTPLKAMSVLTTGVFVMDGLGFVATAGLASPNAYIAVVAGALVMSVEAMSLVAVAHLLVQFPGLLKAADNFRTAMMKLLEIAALVGGMLAANRVAPDFGFLLVAGLYALNEAVGTPVARAALGPVAFILVGIIMNALALIQ